MQNQNFEVLIFGGSGTDNGAYQYRVLHLKEQLDLAGIPSQILSNLSEVTKLTDVKNKILILHRVAWDSEISSVKKFANLNHIPMVYDIDDYVFEPKIIPLVRGVKVLSQEKKDEYHKTVDRYRKALLNCDFAIAATSYLKDRIEELGITAFVHKNSLPKEIVSISEKVRSKKSKSNVITLGYFSGTYTHNYDFLECSDALLQILDEFENVKLMVAGPIDLPEAFKKFSSKIIRVGLVDWKKVPELIANADINLAPLESSNSFCDAKSELKFFEAGILNIPTIASSIASYNEIITNFKNGFIAHNKDEWLEFLRKMITDEKLRSKMGSEASKDSDRYFTNLARSKEVKILFQKIFDTYQKSLNSYNEYDKIIVDESNMNKIQTPLRISWVAPTPEAFQGGFRVITRNCRFLSKFGHSITLYVDPGTKFSTEEEIKRFIEKHYGEVNYSVKFGHTFSECDILIATFWPTAYNVHSFNKTKTKVYFVQDFEPYFYQMGTEYILAQSTYRLGLYHLTVLPWLPPLIKKQYNGRADYFLPPLERGIYKRINKKNNKKKLQIIFYGRPDQPRRCYQLGIQALNIVYEKAKNIDIVIFGSDKIDSSQISFPHTNKKSLATLQDLAELYQNSYLGIVFSTTNPSLLSFEMMACGCPVVDLDIESNRFNYGSEKNVALCEPTPIGVANKILELISDEGRKNLLSENGYNYSQKFPDEETSARKVEELLIKIHQENSGIAPVLESKSNLTAINADKTTEETKMPHYENESTESLLDILISKMLSKTKHVQEDIDTLTDTVITTKSQLKKLDSNIYRFSKTFPINWVLKILKRSSRK